MRCNQANLIDVIACPGCLSGLKMEDGLLICEKCNHQYKVLNGIPDMLIDKYESNESDKK